MSPVTAPDPASVGKLYEKAERVLTRVWDENFHYGYWPGPAHEPTEQATEQLTELVLSHLDTRPGMRILDVGCGIGKPAVRLASEREVTVTGVSVSATEVERANRHAAAAQMGDRARFVKANAMELPFPDGHFDACLAFQSIMHMPDRERAFSEIGRVVRDGGAFTVTDFYLAETLTESARRAVDGFCATFQVNPELYDIPGYRARLATAGFTTEKISTIPDSACKEPTLRRLASGFAADHEDIDQMFGEGTAASMSEACARFAEAAECGYLILSARRNRESTTP